MSKQTTAAYAALLILGVACGESGTSTSSDAAASDTSVRDAAETAVRDSAPPDATDATLSDAATTDAVQRDSIADVQPDVAAADAGFNRETAGCAELANYCGNLGEGAVGANRVCLYRAYAGLCSSGNARNTALTSALRCITARPTLESNYCWTFSDPNSATSCIESASQPLPASVTAFWDAYRAKCPSLNPLSATAEIFPYLSDTIAETLRACVTAANGCAAAGDCLRNNAVVSPFLACGLTLPTS